MKKHIFLITITVFLIGFLYSCENNNIPTDKEPKNGFKDEIAYSLAKKIALRLNNPSVLEFIKENALEKFDGDYNFLVHKSLSKKLSSQETSQLTFKDALSVVTKTNNNETYSIDALEELISEQYPLLQIAVPKIFMESTENWDMEQYIPYVVVVPSNFNDKKQTMLKGFDSNGNEIEVNSHIPPSNPVIVISENERTEITSIKAYVDSNSVYYKTAHYKYILNKGLTLLDSDNESFEKRYFNRDSHPGKDYLYKAKFVDLDSKRLVEPYSLGEPEMRIIVTAIDFALPTPAEVEIKSHIFNANGWTKYKNWKWNVTERLCDLAIVDYDESKYGNRMLYTWIEVDNGDPKPLTLILKAAEEGSVVYSENKYLVVYIKNNDDEVGDALVYYNDETYGNGEVYNTGLLDFWVNQK